MGFSSWNFKIEKSYSKEFNSQEEAYQHFLDDIKDDDFEIECWSD